MPRVLSDSQLSALHLVAKQAGALLEMRLQNLHLRRRAEELIASEQRTVQRTLALQEKERQDIGYQLHEEYAQTLAACNTFLSAGEHDENTRLRMIRLTRQELSGLMSRVKAYSRTFTPTTLKDFDTGEMLHSLVRDIQSKVSFSIRLDTEESLHQLGRDLGLALYRNVQDFLECMQNCSEVTAVLVRLKIGRTVSLLLMDNRRPQPAMFLENDTLVRTIHNRTLHFGGTVAYKQFAIKGNALLINVRPQHRF